MVNSIWGKGLFNLVRTPNLKLELVSAKSKLRLSPRTRTNSNFQNTINITYQLNMEIKIPVGTYIWIWAQNTCVHLEIMISSVLCLWVHSIKFTIHLTIFIYCCCSWRMGWWIVKKPLWVYWLLLGITVIFNISISKVHVRSVAYMEIWQSGRVWSTSFFDKSNLT